MALNVAWCDAAICRQFGEQRKSLEALEITLMTPKESLAQR